MPTSQWQTEELAKGFLEGVRSAIPGANLQFAVIGKIAQLWCPQPNSILDLGCGDGVLGRLLLSLFPAVRTLFLDFSDPMLAAARQKLGSQPNATVATADFSTSAWVECARGHAPLDIVVSGFAIHHQPDAGKRRIYAEVFDLLAPGGLFLNLEHVASATPAGEALFDDFFIDHLQEFHRNTGSALSRADVAQRYYNRPDKTENILAPVDLQCRWLQDIGFRDVDCFFKIFELALFGGRK
jgi:tRNA (cmo5U34)-methyltransferase